MGMVEKLLTVDWRDILQENIKYKLKGTTVVCSLMANPASSFTVRFCAPAFVTRFPRMTVERPETEDPKEYKKLSYSVDLTMKGAGPIQHAFKELLDHMDNSLLDFVVEEQHLLGEAGKSRAQIEGMQNRLFRTRVSPKTGQQYDDAFQPRAKAFTKHGKAWYKNSIAQFDAEGNPTTEEIFPGQVVQCFIRYDGVYCNAAIGFGHSFTLLAVKNLGDPSVYDPTTFDQDNATTFYEFPDVAQGDFPVV